MNRRGFLGAILAAGCAPAIVRAQSLMRCTGIVMPTLAETITVSGYGLTNIDRITRETLVIFEQMYERMVVPINENYFFPPKQTLTIRRPPRYAQ